MQKLIGGRSRQNLRYGDDTAIVWSNATRGQGKVMESGSTVGGVWLPEGYRLVCRLGSGGFGEVWAAEAPGGFPVALKFVRLLDGSGAIEARSLEFIRRIRHPNLLGFSGSWQNEDWLVMAMDLADGSLWDRLQTARKAGLSGIPGDELLGYMDQSTRAVNYLNAHQHTIDDRKNVGLQHRDIKPHNILLFDNMVKLADFGLMRLLEQSITGHTGSLSTTYAAPEFFREQTSDRSDQYSLAITYCQLRSGVVPFRGSPESVISGHLYREPDLGMLSEKERPAVLRALAKEPKDRWESCRAFIGALATAVDVVPESSAAPGPELSTETLLPLPEAPLRSTVAIPETPAHAPVTTLPQIPILEPAGTLQGPEVIDRHPGERPVRLEFSVLGRLVSLARSRIVGLRRATSSDVKVEGTSMQTSKRSYRFSRLLLFALLAAAPSALVSLFVSRFYPSHFVLYDYYNHNYQYPKYIFWHLLNERVCFLMFLGGTLGFSHGMAGGMARRSFGRAALVASMGLFLGITSGASMLDYIDSEQYQVYRQYGILARCCSLFLSLALWAVAGGALGLAVSRGRGRNARIVSTLLGGLAGFLIPVCVYQIFSYDPWEDNFRDTVIIVMLEIGGVAGLAFGLGLGGPGLGIRGLLGAQAGTLVMFLVLGGGEAVPLNGVPAPAPGENPGNRAGSGADVAAVPAVLWYVGSSGIAVGAALACASWRKKPGVEGSDLEVFDNS